MEQVQELDHTLLALDEAALGVGLGRDPNDLPVAEVHLLPHDLAHLMLSEDYTSGGEEVVPHLLHSSDLNPLRHPGLYEFGKLQLLQLSLCPLRDHLSQQPWPLADLADEEGDHHLGDSEGLRQILLGLSADDHPVDDLQLLIEVQWLHFPGAAPQAERYIFEFLWPPQALLQTLQGIVLARDSL